MAPIANELSEEITVGTTRIRLPASVHPRAHATRLGKQVVMDGGYVFLDDAMNRDRTAKLVQDDCKLLGIVYGLAVERGSTSLKREVEDDWAAAIGRVLSAVPMGHWRLALLPSEEADAYAARLALKRALTPLKSELPVLNAGDVAGLACVEERDGSKIRLYMYQRRSKVLQIMEVQASGDEIVNVVRAIMQSWHVVE